jgi:hypothetical protein
MVSIIPKKAEKIRKYCSGFHEMISFGAISSAEKASKKPQ